MYLCNVSYIPEGSWEKFEEPIISKSKKLLSSAKNNESGAAVCAADAMVSGSAQWTALEDSHGYVILGGGGGGECIEKLKRCTCVVPRTGYLYPEINEVILVWLLVIEVVMDDKFHLYLISANSVSVPWWVV